MMDFRKKLAIKLGQFPNAAYLLNDIHNMKDIILMGIPELIKTANVIEQNQMARSYLFKVVEKVEKHLKFIEQPVEFCFFGNNDFFSKYYRCLNYRSSFLKHTFTFTSCKKIPCKSEDEDDCEEFELNNPVSFMQIGTHNYRFIFDGLFSLIKSLEKEFEIGKNGTVTFAEYIKNKYDSCDYTYRET